MTSESETTQQPYYWKWRLGQWLSVSQLGHKHEHNLCSGVPRGGIGGGGSTPPPKFRRSSKIVPNSTRLWKLLKIAQFRTPTPQDVRKKSSKILKLPSVRNCFTSAMTNKLVVITISLKVPKIKKMLLYEMKFLVQNYSCLQNPWLGGYRTHIPVLSVLCPQLNLTPRTKFLGTPLNLRVWHSALGDHKTFEVWSNLNK